MNENAIALEGFPCMKCAARNSVVIRTHRPDLWMRHEIKDQIVFGERRAGPFILALSSALLWIRPASKSDVKWRKRRQRSEPGQRSKHGWHATTNWKRKVPTDQIKKPKSKWKGALSGAKWIRHETSNKMVALQRNNEMTTTTTTTSPVNWKWIETNERWRPTVNDEHSRKRCEKQYWLNGSSQSERERKRNETRNRMKAEKI